MDKKQIGQRVKLARVFYEQKTGNKMTQEILANKIGTCTLCNIKQRSYNELQYRWLGGYEF